MPAACRALPFAALPNATELTMEAPGTGAYLKPRWTTRRLTTFGTTKQAATRFLNWRVFMRARYTRT